MNVYARVFKSIDHDSVAATFYWSIPPLFNDFEVINRADVAVDCVSQAGKQALLGLVHKFKKSTQNIIAWFHSLYICFFDLLVRNVWVVSSDFVFRIELNISGISTSYKCYVS